jgi:gas vesicle protein
MDELDLKSIVRRLDSVEKNLDMVLKDRDMFEDILLQLSELKNAVHMNRERQGEIKKELSADIKDVQNAVEDKVQEVKDVVDNKEILIVKPNVFDKVKKMLKLK